MPRAPWQRPRGVSSADALLASWRSGPLGPTLCLDARLPGREAVRVPLPETLSEALRAGLGALGVTSLYAHQAEALALAQAGRDLVVATPTASGKSLCFHLPVLSALSTRPGARALYLMPTRALARDQARSLTALVEAAGLPLKVMVYDGDTRDAARRIARDEAAVIVTNPDMLHTGILPQHARWARFFGGLAFVVVDELHTYAGVFGAHVANVLARLVRVARFHRTTPRFLCASATIANPAEHAARMLGRPVTAVTASGAPAPDRHLVVFDAQRNAERGLRVPHLKLTLAAVAELVRAGRPTLVFAGSRGAVETLTRYLRERLGLDGVPEEAVEAYRGGYLRDTRQRIEDGLRAGAIRCVVATTALELGVDIGGLGAVVCAGWPGTLAALWQRFGRAGRRGEEAVLVLVPGEEPLDRYVARDPQYLVRTPVEEARVDPHNLDVMVQHLQCAVYELPFSKEESFGSLDLAATRDTLQFLAEQGVVTEGATRWRWAGAEHPAGGVSLRTVGTARVMVALSPSRETLGELDLRGAYLYAHAGAVYQHEGAAYFVEALDLEALEARVVASPHDWFTETLTQTTVTVVEAQHEAPWGEGARCGLGEVAVTLDVTGYRKLRFHTHEPLGNTPLQLPPLTHHSQGFWITFAEAEVDALLRALEASQTVAPRAHLHDAMRGVGTALRTVAALALMCGPRDLAMALGLRDDDETRPVHSTLYLYDAAPGGAGLSSRLFELRARLVEEARALVTGCACVDGCPACVGLAFDVGAAGRKALALRLLAVPG
ncbi:MAG: DEAD/DEAH box helicase [Myxococcales bacterium]|nr:DEAD/DEAH box helicase [Myxococcales bacterium]